MRPLALLVATALAGAAAPASAGPSVTLNGVNIDGVTSQRFENCTVTIDAQGNVHIEAKGYAVKSAGPADPAPRTGAGAASAVTTGTAAGAGVAAARPGKVTRRYFLATENTPPGPQYDLAI